MLAPYGCRLLLLCGTGVWRYLQIAIEISAYTSFLCQRFRTMNTAMLETNNKPQGIMERFKDFCSLPASRIAELPLSMFDPLNKWFGNAFDWLFDNSVTRWMSELKDNHPKIFWISAVLWIPLSIVFYFYAIDLLYIGAYSGVVIMIGSAIILPIVCKICHLFILLTSR